MIKVKCPTCNKQVAWNEASKWKPFCSERCKMIDLGDWIDEKHRITDTEEKQTFLTPDEPYN